jgi:predicted ester cyclase
MAVSTRCVGAPTAIWALALGLASCAGGSRDKAQPPVEGAPAEAQPAEAPAPPQAPPTPYANPAYWDAFFEEFNKGDFDAVAARFAETPDARTVGMPVPEQPTRGGLVAGWQQARTMLPDNRMAAARVLRDGNIAFAHVVTTGTHTGDVEGLAASGKPVGWTSLFRFAFDEQGLASEMTIYANPMAFAAQAGLVRGTKIPVPPAPENASVPFFDDPGESANNAIVKAWYAAYLDGWPSVREAIPQTFAYNVVFYETHVGRSGAGLDWANKHFQEELKSTGEHEHSDIEIHAIGQFVVVTGTLTALQTKRVPGIGGRGKTWTADFADVYRFEEGKAVEVWWYRNPEQVHAQLRDG